MTRGSCWVSTLAYPNLFGTKRLCCCCCCSFQVTSLTFVQMIAKFSRCRPWCIWYNSCCYWSYWLFIHKMEGTSFVFNLVILLRKYINQIYIRLYCWQQVLFLTILVNGYTLNCANAIPTVPFDVWPMSIPLELTL